MTIAMLRSCGSTSLTTSPPIRTLPLVGFSSPAVMPSTVVFPEPHELAVIDLEIDVGNGNRPVVEDLRQPLVLDPGHRLLRRSQPPPFDHAAMWSRYQS